MSFTPADVHHAAQRISFLLFDCDGVLTDGRIILGANGAELKHFSTKDGMGLALWKRAGFRCGCITGRSSEGLRKRAQELRFDELHEGVSDKRAVLDAIREKYGLKPAEFGYIGDDLNDLPLLGRVGLFFSPADGHEEVLSRAHVILKGKGGKGAVREAVDRLLREKGLLEKIVEQFIS